MDNEKNIENGGEDINEIANEISENLTGTEETGNEPKVEEPEENPDEKKEEEPEEKKEEEPEEKKEEEPEENPDEKKEEEPEENPDEKKEEEPEENPDGKKGKVKETDEERDERPGDDQHQHHDPPQKPEPEEENQDENEIDPDEDDAYLRKLHYPFNFTIKKMDNEHYKMFKENISKGLKYINEERCKKLGKSFHHMFEPILYRKFRTPSDIIEQSSFLEWCDAIIKYVPFTTEATVIVSCIKRNKAIIDFAKQEK